MKSESDDLEVAVEGDGTSSAAAVKECEMKVDIENKPETDLVIDKPIEAVQDTKTVPTEEIEVEVEEFYIKYKNL